MRVHRVAPPAVNYREGLERVVGRGLAIHALLTLKAALVEAGGVVLVLALRRERRKVVAARSTEGKRDGKWREVEALVARVASHRARHYRRGRRWALHALLVVMSAGVVRPQRTLLATARSRGRKRARIACYASLGAAS